MERALARRATGVATGGPPGRALAHALGSLSPRQRAVITALYFKDRAVPEVSADLDVSPQAVTALHRRALLELRRLLASVVPDARATDPETTEPGD
jgi:DNA-directed RNA polymerase specialized sigma24 family protein